MTDKLQTARGPLVAALLAVGLAAAASPCAASGLFSHSPTHPHATTADAQIAATAAQVRQALDERRFVDAGALLDGAFAQGVKSPELITLGGELLIARGRYADALEMLHAVSNDPGQKAHVLEGEGLALSFLGRSDEALEDLRQAVLTDPTLWRAWNGLGAEYDHRRDWTDAEAAYAKALDAPGVDAAVVFNNRGYSRLLQHRNEEASADFVAALQKDPSLPAARTNLRLTLAAEGQYDRATRTGAGDDRAAVLNNVGLVAAARGDYPQAEQLLQQAIDAKGAFYGRASENLQMAHQFAADQQPAAAAGTNAAH